MARYRRRIMPPKYIRYQKDPREHNRKLKEEVYNYLSDDDFYKTYKPLEVNCKNKFIIQRLREIENKRWRNANPELAQKSDDQATGCFMLFILIVLVIFIWSVLF